MIQYRLNGKLVKVKQEHEQQFLEKYPNAVRVEGNQQGVAQDATATLQTTASASQSGDTSSELKSRKKELEKLKSDLDSRRENLNNLESSIKDAKAFNNKSLEQSLVNEYNKVLKEYKSKASNYSEKSDLFNKDLDKYNDLNKPKEEEELGWIDGITEVFKSLGDKQERQKATEFVKNAVISNFKERGASLLLNWLATTSDVGKNISEFVGYEKGVDDFDDLLGDIYSKLDKLSSKEGLEIKTVKGVLQAAEGIPEDEVEKGLLKYEDTGKGFVKGIKSGSAADVIGGAANFIMGAAESVIPAILTRGASIYPQIATPMYVSYNQEKAKALYGEDPDAIKKLIDNNETEVGVPLALGMIASQFEKLGFDGVMKYAVGKAYANKIAGSLLLTMNKEGATEWAQGGITKFSDSLGKQQSTIEASKQAWDHMLSDEGLEDYFSGVVGGGAIGITGRGLNRALRNDDDSVNNVNKAIDRIADLNTRKNKTDNKVLKDALQVEISSVEASLKEYITKSRGLKKYLTEDQRFEMIDLLDAKDKINSKIEDLKSELDKGNIDKKEYGYAFRSLNNQVKKISNSMLSIKNEALKVEADRQAKQIEEQIKVSGLEGTVRQATSQEISEMDLGDKVDSKDAAGSFGFIRDFGDGSFEIVLNKDKPAIGVAAHEFLHAVLKKTLKGDDQIGQQLADALNEHVDNLEGDQSNLKSRLKAYEGRSEIGEETITLMSESILNGDLKFNESFFTKIGDSLRRFLMKVSNGKIEYKFDTGRDVYNFIKDYNVSIKSGKLSKSIVKVAKEGAKGKLVDEAKTETKAETKTKSSKAKTKFSKADAKIPIDKLGKVDSDGNDMTEPGIGNFLYQAEVDQIIKTIKEKGYLDGLIAAKYKVKPVPDSFVGDVITELTPHIKAFKPESNDSLFGYIQSQIRNKAGTVYKNIYMDKGPAKTVDVDATTTEGAPVVQLEADIDPNMEAIDEMGLTDEEVEQRSQFRQELKLDDKLIDKVVNAVIKVFGTNLPNITSGKFKKALTKAFETDLKEPMQNAMGKGKAFDAFLEEFMPVIYKHLPVDVLVAMERLVESERILEQYPNAKRIFTKSYRETSPTKVDELVAKNILPKDVNRESGPQVHTKLPYPGIKKIMAFFRGDTTITDKQTGEKIEIDMLKELGYRLGKSSFGPRKDGLAKRTITEVAFDAVSMVVQIDEVRKKIEELGIAGIKDVDSDLAVIAKQIDRNPNVKFSFSGAKKPDGYTGAALVNDASTLIADIKASGYENVIEEIEDEKTGDVTVRLVKGYEDLKIPQFTVNAVANFYATGNIENAASIGFKVAIKTLKNKFPKFSETIDYYSGVGNLWDANGEKAKTNRKKLSEDIDVIIEALGEAVMTATKFNIFGYQLRMFDPASRKKDKAASKKAGKTIYQKNPDGSPVQGNSYQDLENKKKNLKGKKGNKLPKDLILEDVRIFNSSSGLLEKIGNILKIKSKKEKLAKIAELQPEIDAANKANILLAKHIVKTIITLVWQRKISPISALHILQMQTSITLGLRGLSRLDLIDVREGSQDISEVNPSFKDAVKYYSTRGLKNHINEIKKYITGGVEINPKGARTNKAYKDMADKGRYVIKTADGKIKEVGLKELGKVPEVMSAVEKLALKKMGTKGEHLGPNANTMSKVASLIFNPKANIDKVLNKAFRGHSQMLTSKYITDIIDNEGGKNNDTDFNRVKFLDQSDIDAMVSADNKSYIDVLANHEINILLEDLFVDKENAVKVQELQSKPTSVRYSKSKGMSTFDFDETLIIGGRNFVVATKDGKTVRISSEQWPIKGPALAAQGYKFDFSDFANVRGGKEGPLLQKMKNQVKKYGSKNVFVLTARQQDAAGPIHEWLKTQGINIPLENITGLGKSEGSAKGEWMLQKFAEGYNDMYFVDDALPNVEAVKKVLDNLDIKSKVVQAKVKFSKTASQDFNDMLERSKGVEASLEFSDIDAKLRGAKRDRFRIRFFVPPSAEDLKGLVYAFLGKGEQGNKDLAWFRDNLFTPFAKGIRELNSLRQKMSEEYTALKKQFPNVIKSLNDKVANTEFTVDNAVRVYLWNMAGFEVPGLSDAQKKLLIDHVAKNAELVAFADVLSNITRTEEGYVKPADYWITQNIGSDLHTVAETVNRERFLAEWRENADLIFSKENLNKIEAVYGSNFREALEDMLYRMRTGSNRPSGRTSTENKFLNWINGAVSAVMFFNNRSATLQSLSMVNFLNFEDNNVFKAAKAFANQKQFWADFIYLFNSDMLKQRRAGLKIDVSASELTDAFAQGKNKTEAVIKYMLEKGFIPTKMMDSFAIAMGGSTFYRNRVQKYLSEGMSKSEAENQAFLDFQEIAEETQQSSRPDLISMQQASSLGRLILAWANTPMQYTRLTKKALSDIVNGRGDLKANVSRIIYYGAVQNIIFGTLQTGLAFLMFGDDEEDKDRDKKEQRVLNGMLDTLLRGVGVYGALVSTAKNALIAAHEELGKGYGKKDYSKIMQQLINLSPPIGSKVRKIIGAVKSYDFNKDIIDQMGHGINNPAWNIFTGVVEGVTNAPLDRMRSKLVNVREAVVGNHEMWQRVALFWGWNKWDLGVKDAEIEEARDKVKEQKKKDKKQGGKKTKTWRCRAIKKDGTRCKNEVTTFRNQKCYAHK